MKVLRKSEPARADERPSYRGQGPSDDELVTASDRLNQIFGTRLTIQQLARLQPPEQRRVVAACRRAFSGDGFEDEEWPRLVGELRGLIEQAEPGALRAVAEEKAAKAARIEELREGAQRPARSVTLPPGAAALPAGVLEDVLGGRLFPIDLAVLAVIALTFSTGRVSGVPAARGAARFAGEELLVGLDGRALLEEWHPEADFGDPRIIESKWAQIRGRLEAGGWLVFEKGVPHARMRPGPRLEELEPLTEGEATKVAAG